MPSGGSNQARFVGEDDRLHPIAEFELGKYPPDVSFHSCLGEEELRCDLQVGEAEGDLAEHLALTFGQSLQPLVGAGFELEVG